MPKTRYAFALRDFDQKRILQRPFFRTFGFDIDKTDEEILKSLSLSDDDNFLDIDTKIDLFIDLLNMVTEYQVHIMRHGDRLIKYLRAVEYKIATDVTVDIKQFRESYNKAQKLLKKYCGIERVFGGLTKYSVKGIAVNDIGNLCKKISEYLKELQNKMLTFFREIFAERLRQSRKELKLNQTEFGKLLGFSQRAISNYEKAERDPSVALLARLSKKLNRPMNWFIGDD